MSEGKDIRAAADMLRAQRIPLLTALQAAVASLTVNGRPRDKAQAWASAELLAVVADVLATDLPSTSEDSLLEEGMSGNDAPFDTADTEQHLRFERDLAITATQLASVSRRGQALPPTVTEATILAATLAMASIAGVLAGVATDDEPSA